jgi:hypothetical protein
MTRALCPAHAAAPAAATRTAPTAAPAAAAADEAMTLDELFGATAPTSPKVKVEPADQLSTWASLDELPLPTPLPTARLEAPALKGGHVCPGPAGGG